MDYSKNKEIKNMCKKNKKCAKKKKEIKLKYTKILTFKVKHLI